MDGRESAAAQRTKARSQQGRWTWVHPVPGVRLPTAELHTSLKGPPSPRRGASRWTRSRPSTTAGPLTQATPGATPGGAVTACRRDDHATRCRSAPGAQHLPGGDVETVEEVGRGDREDQ